MTQTQATFTLSCGYDRKSKTVNTWRNPESIAEMISYCDSHSHIDFVSIDGTSRRAKVNGKVKTWKRDPNRVEVPIKYGMYEYGTFYASDINRILIPVSE